MAYITSSAQFNPISFQTFATPILAMAKEHREIEDELGELDSKAGLLESMANEANNPRSAKRYREFAEALRQGSDELMRQGLTSTSRRNLLRLKTEYNKKIVPIELAYKARAEENKAQQEGRSRGIVYEGDAATSSVDRYLDNPEIRYNFANSQEGYKRVHNAAEALSKELMGYQRGKKLDPYVNTWLQKFGYSSNDIATAIDDIQSALRGEDNIKGRNVLTSILENEMRTSGVDTWENKEAVMDYYNRVASALYSATGQGKIGTFEDYGAKLAAQEAIKNRNSKSDDNAAIPYDKHYRMVPKTKTSKGSTTDINNDIEVINSIIKNPQVLTKTELVYTPTATNMFGQQIPGSGTPYVINPAMESLKELSKKYGIDFNVNTGIGADGNPYYDTESLGVAIKTLQDKINKSAMRSNAYVVDITDPSLISKTIQENARVTIRRTGKSGLKEIDEDGRLTGDYASSEDIKNNLQNDFILSYEPGVGIVVSGTDDEGKLFNYLADPEVITGDLDPSGRRNLYQWIMDMIDSSIEEGELERATDYIDEFMNNMYARLNSISKIQSKTLRAKEEKGEE